jgi:hypothetical protein
MGRNWKRRNNLMTQKGDLMAEAEADERPAELSRGRCLSVSRLPGVEEEHLAASMEHFLSGSASKDEARAVVRHLLAKCPSCSSSAQRSLLQSPYLLALREVAEPE